MDRRHLLLMGVLSLGCSALVPGPGDLVPTDGGGQREDGGRPRDGGVSSDGGPRPDGSPSPDGGPDDGGIPEDACVLRVWYPDRDDDGYGVAEEGVQRCGDPATGYVATAGDCNDDDENAFPGAAERCNGADDDCDTAIDEGLLRPLRERVQVFERNASALLQHEAGYLAVGFNNAGVAARYLDLTGTPLGSEVDFAVSAGATPAGAGAVLFRGPEGERAVVGWREGRRVMAQVLPIGATSPVGEPLVLGETASGNVAVVQLASRAVFVWHDEPGGALVARAMDPVLRITAGAEARLNVTARGYNGAIALPTSPPSALVASSELALTGQGVLAKVELTPSLVWRPVTAGVGAIAVLPSSERPLASNSTMTSVIDESQCLHALGFDADAADVGACQLFTGFVVSAFDRGGSLSLAYLTLGGLAFSEIPIRPVAEGTPPFMIETGPVSYPDATRLSFRGASGVVLYSNSEAILGGGGRRYTAWSRPIGCTP